MSKTQTFIIADVPEQYKDLAKRFPLGVAQIVPKYDAYDYIQFIEKPTKTQREDINNHRRPRTNGIMVELPLAKGTHPVTGMPNIVFKVYEIEIFPNEPFTNKLKGLSTDFKSNPWAIIDALVNHDGYGVNFTLVAPPEELYKKLEANAKRPEVKAELNARKAEMSTATGRLKELDSMDPFKPKGGPTKKRNFPSIGTPGADEEYGGDEGLDNMEVAVEPTAEELEVE